MQAVESGAPRSLALTTYAALARFDNSAKVFTSGLLRS